MNFSVVIATSQKRTDWLINRSLLSIYNQFGINKSEWNVFVVDDNKDKTEFLEIQKQIKLLRSNLKLNPTEFPTIILKNTRTQFMSGTGSWNTGVYEAHRIFPNGFVSILDDDDEYLSNHLSECETAIRTSTIAVFQQLIWHNDDKSTMNVNLTKESLTAENFFIGNPGVQGSNMFFKTKNLIEINGFDETLPNTTDRDLMIRFLWKNDLNKIEVIENIGVNHYNHKQQKVNNNITRKQQGLDLFYKKYKAHFSEEAYQKSITRAKKYFNYIPTEQILICMPLKNAEKTVKNAVLSVLQQANTKREIVLLVGNDNSTDNSETILKEIALQNSNIVLLNVNFGKAYLNRNFLNKYARKNYPNCILIGRLDADDVICTENTISQIEKLFDETNFDVLICGNKQVKNGDVLERENKPSKKLLQEKFLLNQLFEMTQGNPEAELPSCNTFIKPTIKTKYPSNVSAEDHWFTVLLLLQKKKLNILIDEKLLYCIYSLDGIVSENNKESLNYLKSRKKLYFYYKKTKSLKSIKVNWNEYINSNGLDFHLQNIKKNKEKLAPYWGKSMPLNKRIQQQLEIFNNKKLRLLDVGCGPFPKSGIYHPDYKVTRILVDALANKYHELLHEHSINTSAQKIINYKVEEIGELFKPGSFEVIFAKNTLDHTYNPINAIKNLINLLSDDGVAIFDHFIQEGKYTNYFGLHQWNFSIENGDFYISNKEKNIIQNMNTYLNSFQIESFYEENKIITIIRKNET